MKFGIWLHVHVNAYGNGEKDLYNGWQFRSEGQMGGALRPIVLNDKWDVAKLIRGETFSGPPENTGALLSSSHRSFTVEAFEESSDNGVNAICEQCGGPTRRTSAGLTVAQVWSAP